MKGQHQTDLLAVALRQDADRAVELDAEPLDELVPVVANDPAAGVAEPVQMLPAAQTWVQREIPGQVTRPEVNGDGGLDRVRAEDAGCPGGRADQAQQEADSGGLAGTVGPRKPKTSPEPMAKLRSTTPRCAPK